VLQDEFAVACLMALNWTPSMPAINGPRSALRSISAIAEVAGVSRQVVYRVQDDPAKGAIVSESGAVSIAEPYLLAPRAAEWVAGLPEDYRRLSFPEADASAP
jgi:hypothetical protein